MADRPCPPAGQVSSEPLNADGWRVVTLGEIMQAVYRYPTYYGITYEPEGVAEVRGEMLSDAGEINAAEARFIATSTARKFPRTTLAEGDMVMSVRGTMGKVGLVRANLQGANITANLIRLSPNSTLADSEFLKFCLLSRPFNKRLNDLSPNTTIKTITASVLKSIPLVLPPLHEQRAIAHALHTIQQAKEATDNVIATLKQLMQSVMHYLFTYGPAPYQRVHQVQMQEGEDGNMPSRWKLAHLGELAQISTGTTPATAEAGYYGGSIPFIKTAQISNNRITRANEYITEKAAKDYRLKLYPRDTVFMAMYGQGKTRGQVALLGIEATTTQNTAAIVPGERLAPEFLWFYLMSKYEALRSKGFQGQISHLNLGYVSRLQIPLPEKEEQSHIARILATVQGKLNAEEARRRSLEVLFESALQNLTTGALRVGDVPLAEPAWSH